MRNIEMSELDNDIDMDIELGIHRTSVLNSCYEKRTLAELFDFTNEIWIQKFKNSQMTSLNDELKLYEILNADDGDEDGAIEIDNMVETVMAGV